MKTQMMTFALLMLALHSCIGPDKKTVKAPETIADSIKVDQGLPFGAEFVKNSNSPKTLSETTIEKASSIFRKINSPKNKIKIVFKDLDTSNVRFPTYFNDSLAVRADNVIHRLPNVYNYECYYAVEKIRNYPQAATNDLEGSYIEKAGNLVLYDPNSKKSYLINIYLDVTSPYTAFGRIFYIDKENLIHIMEIEYEEEGDTVSASYIIKISKNGSITYINYPKS